MYSTVPPVPGRAPDPGAGWGLRRAVRLAFPDPADLTHSAEHNARLSVYYADMLRAYGQELIPGALESGGQSYAEMAEALIKLAVPEGESVDLLVVAHAIPDVTPGRATATYLSHACPGTPMAFAIGDQGTAGAFTGLRLIRDYAASGGLRRALLLVVEQGDLPYDPSPLTDAPVVVPAGHSAVALLFGDSADPAGAVASAGPVSTFGGVSRLDSVSVHPESPGSALGDEVGALFAGATGPGASAATAILGSALADRVPAPSDVDQVRIAPAEQPYTGVWWELAGALAEPAGHARRLLVADFHPEMHYLCFAAIDVPDPGPSDGAVEGAGNSESAALPGRLR